MVISFKGVPKIKIRVVIIIAAILLLTLVPASILALADSEQSYTQILEIYFEILGFPLAFLFKDYYLMFFSIDCILYAVAIERIIAIIKNSRRV
jgi:hypothetical protein